MANKAIYEMEYSLVLIIVVVLVLLYQVFMVHKPLVKKLKKEHDKFLKVEGMKDYKWTSGSALRHYEQVLSDRDTMLGHGPSPPVFWDIGDPRHAKSVVSSAGYETRIEDGVAYLYYNGERVQDPRLVDWNQLTRDTDSRVLVGDYYRGEDGVIRECPPGHKTAPDGKSCLPPQTVESMINDSKLGLALHGL